MPPVIEFNNVTLQRNGKRILEGVTWRVNPGENWVMLGANGSGKTTVLKVLAGYEWPTQGEVTVLGNRFGECRVPELRKRIGWVSSAIENRFPAWQTAQEIVLSGADASLRAYREFSEEETDRAACMLEQVGAAGIATRSYGVLSQGEQQRVLIARALIQQPALMVLDEPCAGLDPAARDAFLSDMAAYATREGAPSCVFVTHHVEEIGPWINRAVILSGGRVTAQGRVEAVLADEHVTEAFGRPCRLERIDGLYRLRFEGPRA